MSQYAMSGAQPVPRQRITVSGRVFIQDGDAGAAQKIYQATQDEIKSNQQMPSLPMRTALLILGACVLVLLIVLMSFAAQKIALEQQISSMNEAIETIEADNHELDIQLVSARDSAIISYKAVQELGMVSAETAETYYVTAPDTRPTTPQSTTSYSASAGY